MVSRGRIKPETTSGRIFKKTITKLDKLSNMVEDLFPFVPSRPELIDWLADGAIEKLKKKRTKKRKVNI